jgi:hypothetical protein
MGGRPAGERMKMGQVRDPGWSLLLDTRSSVSIPRDALWIQ